MTKLPLEGVRIIEFGFLVAGPLGPRLLAEFGAEILKVESQKRPDGFRPGGGFSGSGAHSQFNRLRSFNEFNRNKRGVAVDLTTQAGRDVIRRLVRISDVVVDNYSAGVLTRWGLDYESLCQVRPDIISVHAQGLGRTGPYRDYVTWGPSLMAISGMTWLWTQPDSPEPVGSQTAHPDYVCGDHVAFVVMAALHYRNRTGKGQRIDLGQVEATASLLGPHYLDYTVNGRVPQPQGNRSPYYAPYNCYRCAGEDRWCVIAITSEEEWMRFGAAIGSPPWTTEDRFADMLSRVQHVEELDPLVESWTLQHTPHEVMELLQRAGVAAAAVQNGKDLHEDPHLRERGYIIRVDHPDFERQLLYPAPPIHLSETPSRIWRPAPRLGEDNEYVFGELLGMSTVEIGALTEEGVLI